MLMSQRPTSIPAPMPSATTTATLASGIPTTFHVRSRTPSWVLDSGANDHMTGELSLFSTPLASTHTSVCLANRSITISKGGVRISSDITLSSVLYVPQLAFNLLLVSRLAKSFNCVVIFLSDCCLLQDRSSKRIFGKGYERDELYYFGDPLILCYKLPPLPCLIFLFLFLLKTYLCGMLDWGMLIFSIYV